MTFSTTTENLLKKKLDEWMNGWIYKYLFDLHLHYFTNNKSKKYKNLHGHVWLLKHEHIHQTLSMEATGSGFTRNLEFCDIFLKSSVFYQQQSRRWWRTLQQKQLSPHQSCLLALFLFRIRFLTFPNLLSCVITNPLSCS